MRLVGLLLFSLFCLEAATASDAHQILDQLREKRESLTAFHQEFEISRAIKTAEKTQASKSSVMVDSAKQCWRERSLSGAGDRITIFDGKDLFEWENGDSEYARVKRSSKDESPQPGPYSTANLDFSKGVERARGSCGLPNVEDECVTLDFPLKQWVRIVGTNSSSLKMVGGTSRLLFDTVTGLLISSRTVEAFESGRGGYQSDSVYVLKRMSYNGAFDASLFSLPAGVTSEVKELSRWNADRIKKQLAGKTAPDLALTDLQGKTIKISELKGKTVLLDFWTTWCGPCRADGPSLDKLYQKYGDKNLALIGVSVNEERPVVQKFLSEHPHKYSIALTTENDMPRAYQIGEFPTYIVINADGNVASASAGEKGFSELRKLLKKAGLETD